MQRLGAGIRVEGHRFAPPWIIQQVYGRVVDYCHGRGVTFEPAPFPADLCPPLQQSSASAVLTALDVLAAQDGCAGR